MEFDSAAGSCREAGVQHEQVTKLATTAGLWSAAACISLDLTLLCANQVASFTLFLGHLQIVKDPLDPRIHFALVCGAKSCPPIKVYTSGALEEGLEAAASAFCEGELHLLLLMPGYVTALLEEVWLLLLSGWLLPPAGVAAGYGQHCRGTGGAWRLQH